MVWGTHLLCSAKEEHNSVCERRGSLGASTSLSSQDSWIPNGLGLGEILTTLMAHWSLEKLWTVQKSSIKKHRTVLLIRPDSSLTHPGSSCH